MSSAYILTIGEVSSSMKLSYDHLFLIISKEVMLGQEKKMIKSENSRLLTILPVRRIY